MLSLGCKSGKGTDQKPLRNKVRKQRKKPDVLTPFRLSMKNKNPVKDWVFL
jgi:hypothetical protein